jgi:3-oxoadipate enol-lactonase
MELLAHDVTGDGFPVVLIHSTAADRRMWDGVIPALKHRVVRCDLRGYGESPVPAGRWSDAADVVALLDHLGIGRFSLVGASGGGRVALEVAQRAADRVPAMVLLCPAWPGQEPSAPLRDFAAHEDALLEAGDVAGATELNVRTWLGPEADESARNSLRIMQENAFRLQLGATGGPERDDVDLATIGARTLVVTGAHDLPDFRREGGELPQARHVELGWAGHLPVLEAPGLVGELLAEHLQPQIG